MLSNEASWSTHYHLKYLSIYAFRNSEEAKYFNENLRDLVQASKKFYGWNFLENKGVSTDNSNILNISRRAKYLPFQARIMMLERLIQVLELPELPRNPKILQRQNAVCEVKENILKRKASSEERGGMENPFDKAFAQALQNSASLSHGSHSLSARSKYRLARKNEDKEYKAFEEARQVAVKAYLDDRRIENYLDGFGYSTLSNQKICCEDELADRVEIILKNKPKLGWRKENLILLSQNIRNWRTSIMKVFESCLLTNFYDSNSNAFFSQSSDRKNMENNPEKLIKFLKAAENTDTSGSRKPRPLQRLYLRLA